MSNDASPPRNGDEASRVEYGRTAAPNAPAGIVPGAFVRDADTDQSDIAVVVFHYCRPVADVYCEIEVNGEKELHTVASLNPSYSETDPCVKVAFIPDLDHHFPEWRSVDRAMLHPRLQQSDVKTYDYPESRLEAVNNE